MKISVENFGCRLNALEGDIAREAAQKAGLKNAHIVNGCAVTAEALRQARQAARRAHRTQPDRKVIVTGCAAQIAPEQFASMPEVAKLLGNEEKRDASAYRAEAPRVAVGDIMRVKTAPPARAVAQNRARAFLQVQTGCDHRCTFCVIPFGRGNARSTPAKTVIAQARALTDAGHKELVLTGVDLTSWGADIGEAGLGALVRRILDAVPSLPRLRLSSLDVIELDAELRDIIAHEPRLCPHLHLSLQSGDDMILKRMKRRHNRAQAVALCEGLRKARPALALAADLIAGFPTETDAMFENTRALIADCGLSTAHIFPYSPRPNTPAAKMPQLPPAVIKHRARLLRETANKAHRLWQAQQIGQSAQVLIEQDGIGRSGQFAKIRVAGARIGQLRDVMITAQDADMLVGEPL